MNIQHSVYLQWMRSWQSRSMRVFFFFKCERIFMAWFFCVLLSISLLSQSQFMMGSGFSCLHLFSCYAIVVPKLASFCTNHPHGQVNCFENQNPSLVFSQHSTKTPTENGRVYFPGFLWVLWGKRSDGPDPFISWGLRVTEGRIRADPW